MTVRPLSLLLLVTMGLAGCALFGQARDDYERGKPANTPLAETELAPKDQSHNLLEPIVPFLPDPLKPAAGVVAGILTVFLTWQRGRRIRKNQPPSTNNYLGVIGNLGIGGMKLEGLLQFVTTAIRGVYEVGPDGSGVKRGWKVIVSLILALLTGSITIPAVREFVLHQPQIVGIVTLLSGLFAGIEKELSKALPVKPTTPSTPPIV